MLHLVCRHLALSFGPHTNTRFILTTVDDTGETGQTVFRLQWDINFPVSSNQVCHIGHTQSR